VTEIRVELWFHSRATAIQWLEQEHWLGRNATFFVMKYRLSSWVMVRAQLTLNDRNDWGESREELAPKDDV
jgi:hypothetical protein